MTWKQLRVQAEGEGGVAKGQGETSFRKRKLGCRRKSQASEAGYLGQHLLALSQTQRLFCPKGLRNQGPCPSH